MNRPILPHSLLSFPRRKEGSFRRESDLDYVRNWQRPDRFERHGRQDDHSVEGSVKGAGSEGTHTGRVKQFQSTFHRHCIALHGQSLLACNRIISMVHSHFCKVMLGCSSFRISSGRAMLLASLPTHVKKRWHASQQQIGLLYKSIQMHEELLRYYCSCRRKVKQRSQRKSSLLKSGRRE